ncbi:RsmB/NOP family class I SAM-dependent RNA methyltransferase [Sphingobium aquiterrae]|uniref:RsmB/NOP family class I SAM-dependent RNA methyltransferase n=1 Tax=Sphingobium aquiterrae TaxID=2038656 RepID=UPI0030186452
MTTPRYPAKPPRPATPPGVPARRAALKLIDAVLRRGEPLEIALHGATQGLPDRADRALVHAITAETLRHLPDLDALIDSATPNPLPDDAKARAVLRMALAQALLLGTPPHAAIATALPLVDGGPRKLVHGVFGTLMRGGAHLPAIPSLPADLAARWSAMWGEAMVEGAARAFAVRPPVDVTLRDSADTEGWAQRLGGVSLAPGHVRLSSDHDAIAALPGFVEGAWWVQDLAASLPARLLGAGEGQHVLDLCAAPGGKTMQLAAAGWRVTALDQSAKRLARLAENLERTGLAAQTVTADLRAWEPEALADAVLLDAPCSATGIYRRHPDVIHRIGPRQIAELAELQATLLDRAALWVKPGGTLVYATCSLERAEGEDQIAAFLARTPGFAVVPPEADELPDGIVPTAEGWVRTLPGTLAEAGGTDGFFIARLRRG